MNRFRKLFGDTARQKMTDEQAQKRMSNLIVEDPKRFEKNNLSLEEYLELMKRRKNEKNSN